MTSSGHQVDPLELLTITQLARLTNRSRRSLYRDIAAGHLHPHKVGRLTFIQRIEAQKLFLGDDGCEADE